MGSSDKNILQGAQPVRILTGQGGAYEVTGELREMVCLTDGGELFVSQSHAANQHVLGFMERLTRNKVEFRITKITLGEIRGLYETAIALKGPVGGRSQGNGSGAVTFRQTEVMDLIKKATSRGASDIHFLVQENECVVRYRIDGNLETVENFTVQHGTDLCATLYQSMCDVADKMYNAAKRQDGRIARSYVKQCGLYSARVATRPTDVGSMMVVRFAYDHGDQTGGLEGTGYLAEQIILLRRMIGRAKGIKIFSGGTGSGKTTSLGIVLSMLQDLTEGKRHLLTIEDPPEIPIKGANHTPVGGDKDDEESISQEWAASISNAMRLDPDNIFVGEIRDLMSAKAAFRAAMTGHGVWTTLHANDVLSVVERLRDLGVELSLLTDPALVTGLVNQSLARKLCASCKRPFEGNHAHMSDDLVERIKLTCDTSKVYLKGDGCQACNGSGIRGRTAIAEMLIPTHSLMKIFKSQGKAEARQFWVRELGGITKNQHLIFRINEGLIDPALAEIDVCSLDEDLITLEG